MTAYLVMVVGSYLALGLVDLPRLWGRPRRRGEWWAVLLLLSAALALAVATTLGYRPLSVWRFIQALFTPIGRLFPTRTEG